ncbi:hypothetical protein [Pantoea phage LIMEzero]|uniref:Uncharacterized protein n=1 Tax=Pantoea phage LIMEzero TaxID=943335 RepID=F4N9T5_9CAUD|nr:anti-termination protein Q-like [Pantoea phage LIMEzero]CBY88563.1 hypothetical protein [Pantoea phage LIMEzero]
MQRVIADTTIDGHVCGACKGSGTYIGRKSEHGGGHNPVVVCECEACGGTGTNNPELQRSVLLDLGQRVRAQPDYTEAK